MNDFDDMLTDFARAIVTGSALTAAIEPANYPADVALEVYRNNYRGNLQDALAGTYPVTRRLVGDDFFRFMARQYIGLHPSKSANLHRYGEKLADFLADFEPAQSLAYLPDVARLEWACQLACFAADEAQDFFASLARVPPERYPELVLHASCRIIRSDYPIAAIWHAHQADGDFDIDPGCGAVIALVSRRGDAVVVDELSEADAHWLQCIQQGQTLGVATAGTLEKHPGFDLQQALRVVGPTGFSYGART